MKSAPKILSIVGLTLLWGLFLVPGVTSSDPLQELPQRVQKFTLKNGLRLLVLERPNSPTISFSMFIRTGAIDDEPGQTGLAHMFEHMLFKGTPTIGTRDYRQEIPILAAIDEVMADLQEERDRGELADSDRIRELNAQLDALNQEEDKLLISEEFWQIYERAGAQNFNASTGYDYTNYVVSLPLNQLKLWMMMEKDRIQNPVLREFYKERSVVLEERRERMENSPHGKLWSAFLSIAFQNHPYRRPIIGWEDDISRVTRKNAEDFFHRHYDVSRLVVAIVGGVQTAEVEKMARDYLEPIPSTRSPRARRMSVEPPQEGERRVSVEFDAEPSLLVGFHRPNFSHADAAALDVAADILSDGRTSRFYRSLVEGKKVAVSAWAHGSAPGEREPHLFVMGGTPRPPFRTLDLERALEQEIETLKKDGPTPQELERVKNNLEADLIRQLANNASMADQLAYYEAVADDWRFLLRYVQRLQAVTAADVQRVAATYFTPSHRTVATLVKTR